jgi:hypothetical protein
MTMSMDVVLVSNAIRDQSYYAGLWQSLQQQQREKDLRMVTAVVGTRAAAYVASVDPEYAGRAETASVSIKRGEQRDPFMSSFQAMG